MGGRRRGGPSESPSAGGGRALRTGGSVPDRASDGEGESDAIGRTADGSAPVRISDIDSALCSSGLGRRRP